MGVLGCVQRVGCTGMGVQRGEGAKEWGCKGVDAKGVGEEGWLHGDGCAKGWGWMCWDECKGVGVQGWVCRGECMERAVWRVHV